MPLVKRWWEIKVKGGNNSLKENNVTFPVQDYAGLAKAADHSFAKSLNVIHIAGHDGDGNRIIYINNNVFPDQCADIDENNSRRDIWDQLLLYFFHLLDSFDPSGLKPYIVLYYHAQGADLPPLHWLRMRFLGTDPNVLARCRRVIVVQ
eukprot:CAMPEP_0113675570 /NCGR_PEP_ID=MMETSP0038_2-20120614/8099_1 /TAXON_ID=2898 /ORGANISM="Cryptomonas paramecium" /LENGTH=148 /DNA_ID=CAMNT_0000592379 /DNA_START=86 /DNA_END=529 /DNA_ORIENTATION=+ /assembly_acc=CAM_ASM_000170